MGRLAVSTHFTPSWFGDERTAGLAGVLLNYRAE
jgi:hypothetical protein